jgi:peptidoglycan-associated lipoprotein
MKRRSIVSAATVAAGGLLLTVACSSRPNAASARDVQPAAAAAPAASAPIPVRAPAAEVTPRPEEPVHVSVDDLNRRGYVKDAFFDYDQYEIRPDQRDSLAKDASWLRAHPTVKVLIEGHCDERGTAQYNMALGEERAEAAKDYLVRLGVDSARIRIISYGKERPFATGHDEKAWAENRRDHFLVTAS